MTEISSLPGLDPGQQAAYENIRQRHAAKVAELLGSVGEALESLREHWQKGRPAANLHTVNLMRDDVSELTSRLSALDALYDVTRILDSGSS